MGNYTRLDADVITYALAVPLGLLGLLAYGTALYIIRKSQQYNNVFGILFTSYIVFHIQTISVLVLWTLIRIIVNLEFISLSWLIFNRIASPLANSTLYAGIWMQLILAINRLWAITYPIAYHRIFNSRNAWITVVSLWLFNIIITGLYYNVECLVYFETLIHSWSTLYGPCNHNLFAYIAMFLSDGIIIITIVVDAIAFRRVIVFVKEKKGANETQRWLKQEITFFKETCISTAIYAFFALLFRINIPMSRLTKITYTWLAILTVNGLVFLYFNHYLLIKQNAIDFLRTNAMGLRSRIMRNDLNTAVV